MFARGVSWAVIGVLCMVHSAEPAQAANKLPVTPISAVTKEYAGKRIAVQGTVKATRGFKAGTRFTLEEAGATITVVLFDRAIKPMPSLEAGAQVAVVGKVDFFKEEAQIIPTRAADVVVIKAAPLVTPVALSDLSAAQAGEQVTVSGTVFEASAFSAGFKFAIDDGRGRVRLVLFEKSFERLAAPDALNIGATVTATGRLSEYNGALEVAVDRVVVVAAQQAAPARKEYALGAISGNDHNALVLIRGEIADVLTIESGLDVIVKDASGAQRVRLTKLVAAYVEKRVSLQPGVRVNVFGRVRAAKSTGIRIEVAVPGDMREE